MKSFRANFFPDGAFLGSFLGGGATFQENVAQTPFLEVFPGSFRPAFLGAFLDAFPRIHPNPRGKIAQNFIPSSKKKISLPPPTRLCF
jgi:hypothetical protein